MTEPAPSLPIRLFLRPLINWFEPPDRTAVERDDGVDELRGQIGGVPVSVFRNRDERLTLETPRGVFDLEQSVVSHKDDDGRVHFWIRSPEGAAFDARYRRGKPRMRDRIIDMVDFTADEPWTWEDGDFGLFVFNIATWNGPVKYRHLLRGEPPATPQGPSLFYDATEGRLGRAHPRSVDLRLDDLQEARAKFELSGIWAGPYIVLRSHKEVFTWPIGAPENNDLLRSALRRLPDWDSVAEGALDDAEEYASRRSVGPSADERPSSRAERPLWRRLA